MRLQLDIMPHYALFQLFQSKFVFVFSHMIYVMAAGSSSLGSPLRHQSSPLDQRYRLLTIADIEGYKAS